MKKDTAKLMTENKFWSIIKESGCGRNLEGKLSILPEDELFGFKYWWDYFCRISYKEDLWAVAYVVMNGCSEVGFDYFRFWLIARGREVFYHALEDADSLCNVFLQLRDPGFEDYPSQETLNYAVIHVIENVLGKDFEDEQKQYEMHNVSYPELEFEWDEGDEDSVRKTCPCTFDRWWHNDLF